MEVSRRALVTGGGRGIGAAIAKRLAAQGHEVIINYKSRSEDAQATLQSILDVGGRASLAQFDVTDADQTLAAIETIQAQGEPVQIIVNNAGIARDGPFPSMKREDWSSVMRTTLDGFFNVTQPFVMPMCRTRWGRIINVSSISGLRGNRGQVNYSAAKAGLIGATKALSMELAKRKITVNAVAPGPIDTEMVADAPMEHILPAIPMRRLGTADEVAAAVAFLASEDASYITGQVLAISGGLS